MSLTGFNLRRRKNAKENTVKLETVVPEVKVETPKTEDTTVKPVTHKKTGTKK